MLKDIRKITKYILNQFEPQNKALADVKACYDVYRKLALVIDNAHLVTEHYLAFDFTEHFIQNTFWTGFQSDKWRRFLNEDLEKLNSAIKEYLIELMGLSLKDAQTSFDSLMSQKYNVLHFYGFIRDEYSVGYVDPCGFSLMATTLNTKMTDNKSIHMQKFQKLNLESYESRVALQESLREEKKLLEAELTRLKSYIVKNYTLEMLL